MESANRLVGMINAINHSDGLDGLAGGESLFSLGAIALLAILADGTVRCGRLNARAVPASSKLTPEQLQNLLGNEAQRQDMGRAGAALVQANRSALPKLQAQVERLLA